MSATEWKRCVRWGVSMLMVVMLAAGCGQVGDALAENPPPYQGAAELELGEFLTFGEGHRLTIHEVVHRQTAMVDGTEMTGLAAEVEVCAGEGEVQPNQLALRFFAETPSEWQGRTEILHATIGPNNVGLRKPKLIDVGTLSSGECGRGWIDTMNVQRDRGAEPTRIGFQVEPGSETYAAVWPAEEV